jgi:hypothetical protein
MKEHQTDNHPIIYENLKLGDANASPLRQQHFGLILKKNLNSFQNMNFFFLEIKGEPRFHLRNHTSSLTTPGIPANINAR